MCGRYTLAANGQLEFRTRFGLSEQVEVRQRFNVCPGDDVLAVIGGAGQPEAAMLRWGLVPHWADDPKVGYRMINARSETAAAKPAFADSLRQRRCLILADGFYEWQANPSGGRKQPWHITLPDREPFAFAGLWASWWPAESAEPLRSCSILTRAAEPEVSHLHDRQPVILTGPDAEAVWLDGDTPHELIDELLRAGAPRRLEARAVGLAVSDARYDGPACLEDAQPDAQASLFEL
jgi:putative SOS response-associated peptidase YedK